MTSQNGPLCLSRPSPPATVIVVVVMGLSLSLLLLSNGASATENLVVGSNTTLQDTTQDVAGNVTVTENATLTLEGVDLAVGDKIVVEAGATLHLSPAGNRPTVLSSSDVDGFWIAVNGTITSEGAPRSRIDGLSGRGLFTAMEGRGGGFHLRGNASLADITITNGTAPVTVYEGSTLKATRATVADMGQLGLVVLGHLNLTEYQITDVGRGILGRHDRHYACQIALRDGVFNRTESAVHLNGCDAEIAKVVMNVTSRAVSMTGQSDAVLTQATITGYQKRGIAGWPQPGLEPDLVLEDVFLDPGSSEAWYGVHLRDLGRAVVRNTTVPRHQLSGLYTAQTDLLLANSTLYSNEEYGVHSKGGAFRLGEGNSFGSKSEETLNGAGALGRWTGFPAEARQPDGTVVPGLELRVFDPAGETVFGSDAEDTTVTEGTVWVSYRTYSSGTPPEYLGPYRYEATHPALSHPVSGRLPRWPNSTVVFPIGDGDPAETSSFDSEEAIPSWGVAASLVALGTGVRIFAVVQRPGR